MLRQVISTSRNQPVKPVVTRLAMSARFYSKDHLKKKQDATEKAEQKMFDKNKKELEQFEHGKGKKSHDYRNQDLREKGENARIEQNRPDDGVY